MKYQDKIKSIPLGEVKCIWMTAGAVDYKLCSAGYNCDSCEFYSRMRNSAVESISPESAEPDLIFSDYDFGKRVMSILNNYDLKDNLLYKDNHLWIRIIDQKKIQIGIDAFAGNLLPKNKNIVLPVSGNFVKSGEPCCWISIGEEIFTIKSPISGFITEVNYKLIQSPDMLSISPYEDGWLFYIQPSNLNQEEKRLLTLSEIENVTKRDIEKINKKITFDLMPSVGISVSYMMDGGNRLTHISDILGPKKFNTVLSCIFKLFV